MKGKIVLGIDLGTTYSCIAYMDEYGQPSILKNLEGELTTPSVVYFESENNIIVGNEAKECLKAEPDRTVAFIKRKMGKSDSAVTIFGKKYTPQEISAYILRKLAGDAEDELRQKQIIAAGEHVSDAVITCPAYFGLAERRATQEAGELAGLNVLSIINEPTAAAISYGAMNRGGSDGNETVLVYDLGGGTFDITVMNISGGNVSVICTGGNDQLGGKDWDEEIIRYLVQRCREEKGVDISDDPETLQGLYILAEKAKKSLSAREKVPVTIDFEGDRIRIDLSREEFDDITRDELNRTKNCVDLCFKQAAAKGYTRDRITKFLLVGGSSKMPQVTEMIRREYGMEPQLQEPDEAVAKGAAIYSQNMSEFNDFVDDIARHTGLAPEAIRNEDAKSGSVSRQFAIQSANSGSMIGKLMIQNVMSRTYGVKCMDENGRDVIRNILKINDPLPANHMEAFGTTIDNQTATRIEVYETRDTTEISEIGDRVPAAIAMMTFNTAVPAHTGVQITMMFTNDGTLHISAEEQYCHSHLDVKFELKNELSGEEKSTARLRQMSSTIG